MCSVALYGTYGYYINVTSIVNSLIESSTSFVINNQTFGDPIYSEYKYLIVKKDNCVKVFNDGDTFNVNNIVPVIKSPVVKINRKIPTQTLILYVFHVFNDNVDYFIKHGCFEHPDYKFIIICNDLDYKVECPSYVGLVNRNNVGYDFGGWSDALLFDDLYKKFDNFIFVNSSCRGPFTPKYYKGNWCDIFIDGITDDIKLFGTTINNCNWFRVKDPLRYTHIQSWCFSTDRIGLDILINNGVFSDINYTKTHVETIHYREIVMSRFIIVNGYNIGSLMSYYEGVDFRFEDKMPDDYGIEFLDDVVYAKNYFGETLHPYEMVFIKTNRDIERQWISSYER